MAQYKIKPWTVSMGGYNYDILDTEDKQIARFTAEFGVLNRGDLSDMAGHPLAHVKQRILSLTNEFEIAVPGQEPTTVRKHSANPLDPQILIQGPAGVYDLQGDWKNGDYSLHTAVGQAAQVARNGSLRGTFLIDIADEANGLALLCIAIVMDEEAWQTLV